MKHRHGKLWYLRRFDLLAPLSDEEVGELAALLNDHYVPTAAELLRPGAHDHIYLVKSGAVRISVGEGSRASTVALLGPGRLFGFSSMIGADDPALSATTAVPSFICDSPWTTFVSVMARHPRIMLDLTRSLAQQVFQLETWRERFGTLPPRARLALLLVDLCREFGEPIAGGGQKITVRLTQADLAQMIGTSRETASRLLTEFDRAGWVERNTTALVIRDRTALTAQSHVMPTAADD